MDQRLPLLTGGGRDLPARQQTMRDAIDWSYDLLSPEERTLFRRLAVFVGGFTLESAEAVVVDTGVPGSTLSTGVAALVEASLLRQEAGPDGEPRFRMLETIREFAAGAPGGERRGRGGARAARRALRGPRRGARRPPRGTGPAGGAGPRWTPIWTTSGRRSPGPRSGAEAATFARLAAALEEYWLDSGRLSEGQAWLDHAVALGDAVPAPLQAAVLRAAGWVVRHRGDHDRAEVLAEEALARSREHGDALAVVAALTLCGFVAEDRGEFARSRALHEEALAAARPLDHPFWTGFALRNAGWLALLDGDAESAEPLLQEALARFRRGRLRSRCRWSSATWATSPSGAARTPRRRPSGRSGFIDRVRLGPALGARRAGASPSPAGRRRGRPGCSARRGPARAPRRRPGPEPGRQVRGAPVAMRMALGEADFAAAWEAGRRMSPEEARAEAGKVDAGDRGGTRVAGVRRRA